MKLGLLVLIGSIVAMTMAVALRPGGERQPPTAQAGSFPDLIVESMSSAQTLGNYCTQPAGVKITVRNIGGSAAGPSVTRLTVQAQSDDISTPGIAAGQAATIYSGLTGIPPGDTYTATANITFSVIESDFDNNSLTDTFSVITLPTCTPSPTPTPSPPPGVGGVAQLAGSGGADAERGEQRNGGNNVLLGVALLGIFALAFAAWFAEGHEET